MRLRPANGCGASRMACGLWIWSPKKVRPLEGSADAASRVGWARRGVRIGDVLCRRGQRELAALEERTLKPKGSSNIGKQEFTSSPVVFDFKGKDLIAAAQTMETAPGLTHRIRRSRLRPQRLFQPDFPGGSAGQLAGYSGTRWVLAPGASTSHRVESRRAERRASLQSGWVSREMAAPLTPDHRQWRRLCRLQRQWKGTRCPVRIGSDDRQRIVEQRSEISTFVKKGGLAAGGSKTISRRRTGRNTHSDSRSRH